MHSLERGRWGPENKEKGKWESNERESGNQMKGKVGNNRKEK